MFGLGLNVRKEIVKGGLVNCARNNWEASCGGNLKIKATRANMMPMLQGDIHERCNADILMLFFL